MGLSPKKWKRPVPGGQPSPALLPDPHVPRRCCLASFSSPELLRWRRRWQADPGKRKARATSKGHFQRQLMKAEQDSARKRLGSGRGKIGETKLFTSSEWVCRTALANVGVKAKVRPAVERQLGLVPLTSLGWSFTPCPTPKHATALRRDHGVCAGLKTFSNGVPGTSPGNSFRHCS